MIDTKYQDPTCEDMIEYLKEQNKGLWTESDEALEDESIVAIYYFASHYHGGQWSNLYSALCQAGNSYSPGLSDEIGHGSSCDDLYRDLVYQYAGDDFGGSCPDCLNPMDDHSRDCHIQ